MRDFVFEEAEAFFEYGAVAGVAGDLEVVENAGALEMEILEFTLLFELGWGLWSLLGEAFAFVVRDRHVGRPAEQPHRFLTTLPDVRFLGADPVQPSPKPRGAE